MLSLLHPLLAAQSWLRHCLHKQYKVRYINNSKLRGKAGIIVCQSLVLRLPDYVGKLSYF